MGLVGDGGADRGPRAGDVSMNGLDGSIRWIVLA